MIKEKAIETLKIEAAQLLKSGQTADALQRYNNLNIFAAF